MIPKISSYGKYSSSNYGNHTRILSTDKYDIYYSYNTPIAFRSFKTCGLVVRQNDWGTTTGKHLNWIDGGNKKERIPGNVFEKLLEERLK